MLGKPELKAEPKGVSRKAAKDAREILKSSLLKPKDMAFLCELGVFASLRLCEKNSCRFEKILIL
jgi:hypothetical protein